MPSRSRRGSNRGSAARDERRYAAQDEAGRLPLNRIPPGSCSRQRPREHGGLEPWRAALAELGLTLQDVEAHEPEPAVGNGGLARLAACFLDSLATHGIPRTGTASTTSSACSSRSSRAAGNASGPITGCPTATPGSSNAPTRLHRPAVRPHRARARRRRALQPPVGGRADPHGRALGPPHRRLRHAGGECAAALYTARPSDEFDMAIFNAGDYIRAVERKVLSETVSKVLYPSDTVRRGRELRLVQEYFLVACALRDVVRRHQATFGTFDAFAEKVAIQMNDTHPALAVAELMRILVDEHGASGTGLGDDAGRVRLHQPHAAARGARAVADRPVRARAAPPPADHLTSQPPAAAARPGPVSRRRGARAADVAHRGGPRAARAHGPPRSPAATR